MRIFVLAILIGLLSSSCTTDEQAVDNFNHCLRANELKTYSELELLCDNFIRANYPKKELNDGYERFLNDFEYNHLKHWIVDTVSVAKMNMKLSDTFGDNYDPNESFFHPYGSILTCLKRTNNKRWIGEFINDKEHGGFGPGIISGKMSAYHLNPNDGLNKVVFVTEVVWVFMYYNYKPRKRDFN